MMRSPQGGLSRGEDKLKVVMCPPWGSDPTSGHPGAQERHWGQVPNRRYGVSTWAHLMNGEGSCPPLCGTHTAVKQG